MFNVTIVANTPEEMREKVSALALMFGQSAPAAANQGPAKRNPGRAPKGAAQEKAEETTAEPAAAGAVPSKDLAPAAAPQVSENLAANEAPTRQDAMRALQSVMEKKTPEEAKAVLVRATGHPMMSKVTPEQYGDLIEACREALAG